MRFSKSKMKLLSISTSLPTLEKIPAPDDESADTVDVKAKTTVGWPDNWHKLPPKWKGILLAELLLKILRAFMQNVPSDEKEATLRHFNTHLGIPNKSP